MENLEPEIHLVQTGDELLEAYKEIGYQPAGGQEALKVYAETVSEGTHDYLIAVIGERAVGAVFVKRDGPVNAEKKVFETALRSAFPDLWPISIIYSLHVHPDYRRQNIGWGRLMDAAEQSIADRPDAVPMSALWVECNDTSAVSNLLIRDYRFLKYGDSFGAVLNKPRGVWLDHPSTEDKTTPSTEPVYLMSKDLSELRQPDVK